MNALERLKCEVGVLAIFDSTTKYTNPTKTESAHNFRVIRVFRGSSLALVARSDCVTTFGWSRRDHTRSHALFGNGRSCWYNFNLPKVTRFVYGGDVKTSRRAATSMNKANYAAGLNGFSYCASLHISHPILDPADITASLGIEPSQISQVDQAHRSIPDRVYDFSHWSYKLPAQNGNDIPTFLGQLVAQLSPHRGYLEQVSDSGGEIECFIGIFPDRLCDQSYPHNLLATLAALRINLRLDFYTANAGDSCA